MAVLAVVGDITDNDTITSPTDLTDLFPSDEATDEPAKEHGGTAPRKR